MADELDCWLDPRIRADIEERCYAEISRLARFECLCQDSTFVEAVRAGQDHIGLYSDHGIVHARDVARQVVGVLDRVHGVLIAERPPGRLTFMKAYGVVLAYLHDIGMTDFSAYGRAMHPEFAAQAVFMPPIAAIVDDIWAADSAGLSSHLRRLADEGALDSPPDRVLREMLALCVAHSKSKAPVDLLNNRDALRQLMVEMLTTDLRRLYLVQQVRRARLRGDAEALEAAEDALLAVPPAGTVPQAEAVPPAGAGPPDLSRYYADPEAEAFRWLVSPHSAARALADDAIDTVRALRCADALRQRGTVLKTSAGYEIFVSKQTGRAVFSLQAGDSSLYLLEYPDAISAGEANIAGSELDAEGNLRFSFHRGAFDSPEAVEYAVTSAALVVEDIAQDCITSFRRPAGGAVPGVKDAGEVHLLLEETDDSADFAARVGEAVERQVTWLRGRVRVVPSLRDTSDRERALYLASRPVNWDRETRQELLDRLGRAGQRTDHIDPEVAFREARLAELQPDDVLIDAGAPAAFVYIPMGQGLDIIPLGGYAALPARPWTPLGVTGVIRGATRNATVVAHDHLRLLVVPRGAYLRDWNRVHTPESFLAALEGQPGAQDSATAALTRLEKAQLLGRLPAFSDRSHDQLLVLAGEADELALPAGASVPPDGYLVLSGAIHPDGESEDGATLVPGQIAEGRGTATAATRLLRLPVEE